MPPNNEHTSYYFHIEAENFLSWSKRPGYWTACVQPPEIDLEDAEPLEGWTTWKQGETEVDVRIGSGDGAVTIGSGWASSPAGQKSEIFKNANKITIRSHLLGFAWVCSHGGGAGQCRGIEETRRGGEKGCGAGTSVASGARDEVGFGWLGC